jgi:transposase-like protein
MEQAMLVRYPDSEIPPMRCPSCPSDGIEHFVILEDDRSREEEWRCTHCGIRIAWTRDVWKEKGGEK